MKHMTEKDLCARFLRGGYDGHFQMNMPHLDYPFAGPLEKCISTFMTICESDELSRKATLVTAIPGGSSTHTAIIATFHLNYTDERLTEVETMTLQRLASSETVKIDLSSQDLPRFKELSGLFPRKERWYRRLFRSRTLCLMLVLAFSCQAQAQISFKFSDLFKQNKKSLQNHEQQIVELQLYLEAVKKGYRIARSGLETIRSIRNGEFDVHNLFYTGLWKVNPEIRKLPETLMLLDFSLKAYRNCASLTRRLRTDNALSDADRKFLLGICNNLVADIDANMDALATILTPGKVQMDDQERTHRINAYLQQSSRQLRVSTSVSTDASLLARARTKELTENESIINYYK